MITERIPQRVYFLTEDMKDLEHRILELRNRIATAKRNVGVAVSGGGETWHDNFAFDQAHREHDMWARRLRDMLELRNRATVVEPDYLAGYVGLGRTAVVRDEDTGEVREWRIGSYMVFDQRSSLSYRSPLAKVLLGAGVGAVVEGEVAGSKKKFSILLVR